MKSEVGLSRSAEVAIVELQRPPANALDLSLTRALGQVFQQLAGDEDVRSVVITGEGRSFCAGLDLKAVPQPNGLRAS